MAAVVVGEACRAGAIGVDRTCIKALTASNPLARPTNRDSRAAGWRAGGSLLPAGAAWTKQACMLGRKTDKDVSWKISLPLLRLTASLVARALA
jgi:hypothetical protein